MVPKPNYRPKQILNEEQLDTFMAAIEQDEVWRDFFFTELTTGLRRGEICGLDGRTSTRRREPSKSTAPSAPARQAAWRSEKPKPTRATGAYPAGQHGPAATGAEENCHQRLDISPIPCIRRKQSILVMPTIG